MPRKLPAPKDGHTPLTEFSQLLPDDRNANAHTERGGGLAVASVSEYGLGRSIVVDKNGKIIGGNQITETAAELGLTDITVVESDGTRLVVVQRTDLDLDDPTDTRARALAVADNRVSEANLLWREDVLLQYEEDGLDLSRFWQEQEIEDMRERVRAAEGAENPLDGQDLDATPEDAETRVQAGDIWQLGDHRVGCLDATDGAALDLLLGGETPDMVWADPPYGISIVSTGGYVGGGEAYDIPFGGVKEGAPSRRQKGYVGGGSAHKNRTGKYPIEEERESGTPPSPAPAKRLGSIGGAKPFGSKAVRGSVGAANLVDVGKYFPVIGDDSPQTAIAAVALALELYPAAVHVWWGGNYYAHALPPSSCWLVWDKENNGNFADAELAWTNQKTAVRIFKHMWNGMLKDSERGEKRVHPTQKPVALARWAFDKYGEPEDIILDPFLGSGMSLVAAEASGRRCFGCELSPEYCDVVLARWEALTGETATLIENVGTDPDEGQTALQGENNHD